MLPVLYLSTSLNPASLASCKAFCFTVNISFNFWKTKNMLQSTKNILGSFIICSLCVAILFPNPDWLRVSFYKNSFINLTSRRVKWISTPQQIFHTECEKWKSVSCEYLSNLLLGQNTPHRDRELGDKWICCPFNSSRFLHATCTLKHLCK